MQRRGGSGFGAVRRYLFPAALGAYGAAAFVHERWVLGSALFSLALVIAFLSRLAGRGARSGVLVYTWSLVGLLAAGAIVGAVVGVRDDDGGAKGLAVLAGAYAFGLSCVAWPLQTRLPRD